MVHSNFHPQNLIFDLDKKVLLTGSEDYIRVRPGRAESESSPEPFHAKMNADKDTINSMSSLQVKNYSLKHLNSNFALSHVKSMRKLNTKKTGKSRLKQHSKKARESPKSLKSKMEFFLNPNCKREPGIRENVHKTKNLFYTMKKFDFLENIYSSEQPELKQEFLDESNVKQSLNYVSDLGYLAPETVFSRTITENSNYFSVGVLCYEMTFSKKPYDSQDLKHYIMALQKKNIQVLKDEIPEGWSLESSDFINRILQKDPALRLGAKGLEEILNHPWIKSMAHKLMEKKDAFISPLDLRNLELHKKGTLSEDDLYKRIFAKSDPLGKGAQDRSGLQSNQRVDNLTKGRAHQSFLHSSIKTSRACKFGLFECSFILIVFRQILELLRDCAGLFLGEDFLHDFSLGNRVQQSLSPGLAVPQREHDLDAW